MRGYWPKVYIQYCQGRDWVGGAGFARPLLHFILWLRTCLKKRSGTPFYTWTKAVHYLVLHPRLSKLTCCAPEYYTLICIRFMEIIFPSFYYNKKKGLRVVLFLIFAVIHCWYFTILSSSLIRLLAKKKVEKHWKRVYFRNKIKRKNEIEKLRN